MCMLQESQDVYVTRITRCVCDKNHKMYLRQESHYVYVTRMVRCICYKNHKMYIR